MTMDGVVLFNGGDVPSGDPQVDKGLRPKRSNTAESLKRAPAPQPKHLRPFNTSEIKVLLLENINQTAVKLLTDAGYQVEHHSKALPADILKEKIKNVHAVGIRYIDGRPTIFFFPLPTVANHLCTFFRSKTHITKDILDNASNLLAIGCFCIGTNQVDLDAAAVGGVSCNVTISLNDAKAHVKKRCPCSTRRSATAGPWRK
jgi:hypothetical protein